MLFDLFAACIAGLVVLNAAPSPGAKPPQILAPQSNPYVCADPRLAQNQDLCDRQRYTAHGG